MATLLYMEDHHKPFPWERNPIPEDYQRNLVKMMRRLNKKGNNINYEKTKKLYKEVVTYLKVGNSIFQEHLELIKNDIDFDL